MPIYAYHCAKCGEDFERIESIDAHGSGRPPRCPSCRSPRVEQTFKNVMVKTSRKS